MMTTTGAPCWNTTATMCTSPSRAPYPERFLAMLTEEVKYLVESFWEGLRCDVMVPCI